MKTEIRNNKVYLVNTSTNWNKPEIIISFYETDGDNAIIPDNYTPEKFQDAYLIKTIWRTYSLHIVNDGYPAFTEIIPIKKPKGQYIWKYGEWRKN